MADLSTMSHCREFRTATRGVSNYVSTSFHQLGAIWHSLFSIAERNARRIGFGRGTRVLRPQIAVERSRNRPLFKHVIALAVALTVVFPTYGAQLWCRGKITNSYVDSSGTLIVAGTWRADYTQLCNIKTVLNGVDPITCLTWFSIAIASQTKGLDVQAYYTDPAALACNTLPTYRFTPLPTYFMLFSAGV